MPLAKEKNGSASISKVTVKEREDEREEEEEEEAITVKSLRDGRWGLYIEGQSTMFGTAMNYVTLRLLGKEAEEEPVERGREWILCHGTATAISSWGKM
ncbi:hypothetical protein J1N35_036770 [Gossypium stocksii]|uniref:Squalene cyclase N-terminal domain-containing protein n=1 Tax=Gossypium stocksii TaxID=47602 RepID=A0A9D3UIY8_9ROSI|nr:hypothetical protein J1N35_036770 [Gossypium stocksii]